MVFFIRLLGWNRGLSFDPIYFKLTWIKLRRNLYILLEIDDLKKLLKIRPRILLLLKHHFEGLKQLIAVSLLDSYQKVLKLIKSYDIIVIVIDC